MQYLSFKMLEALEFASLAHKDQKRKYPTDVPYFSHPAAVGLILAKAGFDENIIIAGILHDVVEDTLYTAADIQERFGPVVTELVLGVTEDKKLSWEKRKEAYRQNLQNGPEGSVAISAADLLANRMAQIESLREGVNVWKYFSKDTKVYTEKLFVADGARIDLIASRLKHPLVDELRAVEEETKHLTAELGE